MSGPVLTTTQPALPSVATGWPLLPVPDEDGRLFWPDPETSIRQMIEVILRTAPGEQLMRPRLGAGLEELIHQPNTLTTRSAIQHDIEQALTRWEPRIQLTGVRVTPGEEPSVAWVQISYRLPSDLREDNLVYPFHFGG